MGRVYLAHDSTTGARVAVKVLGARETLKVLDFGISKFTDDGGPLPSPHLTSVATVLGSPRYMFPEQLLSSRDVDASTDIWALGIIFYELLTNGHPFDGTSVTEICASIFTKQPRSMRELVPELKADIALRCLTREKTARWPTARALRSALVALA